MPETLLAIITLITLCGGSMQALSAPIVEFAASDQPTIEVFASEKRATPVSRRLYGQFAEHLYENVYFGMWAQILRNPGFEPGRYFTSEGETDLENRLKWREDFMGVPGQFTSYKSGAAYYWNTYGKGDISYAPSADRINSDSAQSIEIRSLESPEAGIQQAVFLPTHRTGDYKLTIWVKSTCPSLHASICTDKGKELGGADIKIAKQGWQQHTVNISIPTRNLERGQVFLFTIGTAHPGTILLDQCVLFPADNLKGFDREIVRLLKDAKLPLLRFPGGNFVSGYHWKEGIGPVDERPMRNNPAWNHEEYNHVGTDEWMAFCKLVGCEPMICVNAGNGTPEEAADWVEYCNGDISTKYGALRAKNGHPKPYGVKLWEIGNELWGGWQIGHCSPEEYADRYAAFHAAMSKRDPSIQFIALGQDTGWDGPVLAKDAGIIRSISTHRLIGGGIPGDVPLDKLYTSLVCYPVWCEQDFRNMLKQMSDSGVKDPRIAITELMTFCSTPGQPEVRSLTEVPFYTGFVNMGVRMDGLIELITRTALVNHGAGIRKERERVFVDPIYYASRLYATQSGRWPVRIRIAAPQISQESIGGLPAIEGASCLDGVALLDDSGKELNLLITNRYADRPVTASIRVDGFTPGAQALAQCVGGDFMVANSFENQDKVSLATSRTIYKTGMQHTFPPCSLTCITFHCD